MAQGFASSLLIFDTYTYDAFGVLLNPAANGTPNDRMYRAELRDPTTGLIDLRARPTYDPTTGRFGSADPFEGILTVLARSSSGIFLGGFARGGVGASLS